jgi:cytochrome d ubiquinol oxidase subunit II
MFFDPTLTWAAIIAFGIFMYVFMDGFDLGIGILFPFAPSDEDRDLIMNSVAPVWDANETWLVLGGAGLLGAFPLAYAILLPALYIPITLMLIALIFRGVAFEFRSKSASSRPFWDLSFTAGSFLAAFSQGVILGAFVQGFEVEGRDFAGGALAWVSPFSLMTGLGLAAGYALLGVTWLIMKTEADLQNWSFRLARPLFLLVLAFVGLVSIWTPLIHPAIADRWFSWPNIAYLSPVPLLTGLLAFVLHRAITQRREVRPFLCGLGLFLLSYAGLAISLWPNVVPPDITIWEAASAPGSQTFLLAGTIVVIPVILLYTAFSYYIFRGKVRHDVGYH